MDERPGTTLPASASRAYLLAGTRRRSALRRRFLALGVAVLAVLGASMGVSFLGATGTTQLSVSAGSSSTNYVFPAVAGANATAVPANVTSTKYGGSVGSGGSVTAQLPSWSPVANTAGSVTTPGDLAIIDATSVTDGLLVDVYVTNLAALQSDYSSFAFPVNVYYASTSGAGSAPLTGACSATAGCNWQPANGTGSAPNVLTSVTYLTNDSGVVSFNLPPGAYYDITMETGGAYYCTATTSSATASLSPAFYFTAQAY
ncbi:MAG TPA: hypothetical protein VKV23_09995 [Acidimicrobiales bacterium]|jgi:hypothetical protein|nr:hypothetical protein [Acidimicrobiales bacterium]